ncbi:hypothetical protein RRG08_022835 [Elysia crispata]|uniref:Uncharacterized protein n=1 Tax=Elysia crispata TaxID=231223 RepID=A0AAE0Z1I5_9GAST|nr:hypothetical protein RRG08_022835 [Elysia crispata]
MPSLSHEAGAVRKSASVDCAEKIFPSRTLERTEIDQESRGCQTATFSDPAAGLLGSYEWSVHVSSQIVWTNTQVAELESAQWPSPPNRRDSCCPFGKHCLPFFLVVYQDKLDIMSVIRSRDCSFWSIELGS